MPIISADVDMLRAALINLLGHAMKFCAAAHVPRVEVMVDDQGIEIVVRIKDNGVGFSSEAAKALFPPVRAFARQRLCWTRHRLEHRAPRL